MNILRNIIDYDYLQKAIMEAIVRLQQEILQSPHETKQPREVLARAYERLTDEQKIAFILAGGVPSLLHYQQCYIQHMKTGSDTETGQLPVLCKV